MGRGLEVHYHHFVFAPDSVFQVVAGNTLWAAHHFAPHCEAALRDLIRATAKPMKIACWHGDSGGIRDPRGAVPWCPVCCKRERGRGKQQLPATTPRPLHQWPSVPPGIVVPSSSGFVRAERLRAACDLVALLEEYSKLFYWPAQVINQCGIHLMKRYDDERLSGVVAAMEHSISEAPVPRRSHEFVCDDHDLVAPDLSSEAEDIEEQFQELADRFFRQVASRVAWIPEELTQRLTMEFLMISDLTPWPNRSEFPWLRSPRLDLPGFPLLVRDWGTVFKMARQRFFGMYLPEDGPRADVVVKLFREWADDLLELKRQLYQTRAVLVTAVQKCKSDSLAPIQQVDTLARPSAAGSKRMPKDEANAGVRKYLAEHPDPQHVTVRKVARAVGCADGAVCGTPAWRAFQDRRRQKRGARAPKVVSLTDRVEATAGKEDAELQRVIAEQKADVEYDGRVGYRRP